MDADVVHKQVIGRRAARWSFMERLKLVKNGEVYLDWVPFTEYEAETA